MTDSLKNETIIYFGPDPWDGLWRNRHQLMSRFAKDNEVWYVEPPAALRQPLTGDFSRRRLVTRDASGVRVFHGPWWLPISRRAPLDRATLALYLAVLSRLAHLRERRPIVWLSRPDMGAYLDGLPAKMTIYHVVDEYSGYSTLTGEQRQALVSRENELLPRVDAVIVVTPTLFHAKSRYNPNTYHVPNAVDFAAYADGRTSVPEDLAAIPRPVIGYSGLVGARLDLDLLQAAAGSRPQWSFVFVGFVRQDQCQAQIRRLGALPNVHFLGQKTVLQTPDYVRHFDVGVIPYSDNLRARHAGPLKLYEYAAAAKPIVATDFPAARDFEGHIDIVRGRDEFLAACERCLDAGAAGDRIVDNRRLAQNNTWEHRVAQLSRIIGRHVQNRERART